MTPDQAIDYYEEMFLKKHGLLPEQAIARVRWLEDRITEIPTLCRGYEKQIRTLETEVARLNAEKGAKP